MSEKGSKTVTQNTGNNANNKSGKQGLWRPFALLFGVVALIVLARMFGLGEKIGLLRNWIETLGVWGPIVFIGIYTAATVVALPGSVLTLAAGTLFGSVKGVIIVSVASTLGASLAFLIGRYFARDAVAHWLSDNDKFQKLDKMTRDRGAVIVALTRLVPIFPFNLLNYGFGLTNVRFRTYVFWSWLCMLPATILYVVGADAVTKGVSEGKMPWLLLAVIAVVLVIIVVIVRKARRALPVTDKNPGDA